MSTIYQFHAHLIDGTIRSFKDYQDQVILIVNTASKCGFTGQYKGLEALYQTYKDEGLVICGFPCNQFGHQEPGSHDEITQFCERNYGVTFPIFQKIDVNGANAHPLFEFLKSEQPGLLGSKVIKWNFTKFLVDRQGFVKKRFAPKDSPESIEKDIKSLI